MNNKCLETVNKLQTPVDNLQKEYKDFMLIYQHLYAAKCLTKPLGSGYVSLPTRYFFSFKPSKPNGLFNFKAKKDYNKHMASIENFEQIVKKAIKDEYFNEKGLFNFIGLCDPEDYIIENFVSNYIDFIPKEENRYGIKLPVAQLLPDFMDDESYNRLMSAIDNIDKPEYIEEYEVRRQGQDEPDIYKIKEKRPIKNYRHSKNFIYDENGSYTGAYTVPLVHFKVNRENVAKIIEYLENLLKPRQDLMNKYIKSINDIVNNEVDEETQLTEWSPHNLDLTFDDFNKDHIQISSLDLEKDNLDILLSSFASLFENGKAFDFKEAQELFDNEIYE